MLEKKNRILWIAPQRVGSTVFLQSMRGDVTYLKGSFRSKPKPDNPILSHPKALRLRYSDPAAALDLLFSETASVAISKIEYQIFFGQNWRDAPWREKLFEMLKVEDFFIIHGYRRDLFARFASSMYGRQTGMMQRAAGVPDPDARVELSPKHAIANIRRIMEQARRLKGQYEPERCLYLEYDEIVSKLGYQKMNDALGLRLQTDPEFVFQKVVRDRARQFMNYEQTRQAVVDAIGPEACDFDLPNC